MQVTVGSPHLAVSKFVSSDVAGRDHLVIVTKATWSFPMPGERPRPLAPLPFVDADEYLGEPGLSPMRYGSDDALFKPRCDVIFDACAHSPPGEPVTEQVVAWSIGGLSKSVKVTGHRRWSRRLGVWTLSAPQPFEQMPLHYDKAYGGTLTYRLRDKTLADCLSTNPVGTGFAKRRTLAQLDGAAAPCLEALDDPIRSPGGQHRPMAFGPIGRHWLPRRSFSGTYDESWRRNVFPFLPEDFDERFHQCAPPDQQMEYPTGGEAVVLHNMSSTFVNGTSVLRFKLPSFDGLAVRVLRKDYSHETLRPVVDTLFFEPDAPTADDAPARRGRFTAVWRCRTAIRRRIQEFDTVAVGPVDPAWWAAKTSGQFGGGCSTCGPRTVRPSSADDDDADEALDDATAIQERSA